MSHDWCNLNPKFKDNGPYYGLIAAGKPDHYCPRCFNEQHISNRGKICSSCEKEVCERKDRLAKLVAKKQIVSLSKN